MASGAPFKSRQMLAQIPCCASFMTCRIWQREYTSNFLGGHGVRAAVNTPGPIVGQRLDGQAIDVRGPLSLELGEAQLKADCRILPGLLMRWFNISSTLRSGPPQIN